MGDERKVDPIVKVDRFLCFFKYTQVSSRRSHDNYMKQYRDSTKRIP